MKDVELIFKDAQGYGNTVRMKDIIVISESSKDGLIVVETCKHGTFAFIKDDSKVDILADREYLVDNATLYEIARSLGLTGGV